MAANSQPPTALKPAACFGNICKLNSEMLVFTSLFRRRRLETATKFHKRWLIYRLLAMSSLLLLILVPSEEFSLWNPPFCFYGGRGLPSSKRVHYLSESILVCFISPPKSILLWFPQSTSLPSTTLWTSFSIIFICFLSSQCNVLGIWGKMHVYIKQLIK